MVVSTRPRRATSTPLTTLTSANHGFLPVKRTLRTSTRIEVKDQAGKAFKDEEVKESKTTSRKRVKMEQKEAVVTTTTTTKTQSKRLVKSTKNKDESASSSTPLPLLSAEEVQLCTTTFLPPLSFSLSDAKDHLVRSDVRFKSLVRRIPMRIFEELDDASSPPKELDLFKTLVTSILGQQVSWLAARAILYKFIRLWFGSTLPLQPDFKTLPRDQLPFPTPLQVVETSDELLRSAGLSGQKVKYVKDIAQRFSDGRLDVRKILVMGQDKVVEELVKIKGVGIWTAQMLLIFALRRPDILPVGDLGVQRGVLLLWASDQDGPSINTSKAKSIEQIQQEDLLQEQVETDQESAAVPSIPPEANMTASVIQARKNGTKTKGKQYLTPQEMEALCQEWKPYRSIASVIMWGLVDA
ncbi:unnamed protein product [Sympodiomycopsis kandeliae]